MKNRDNRLDRNDLLFLQRCVIAYDSMLLKKAKEQKEEVRKMMIKISSALNL